MGRLALDLTLLTRAHIANILQMILQHPDHQVTSHLRAHAYSRVLSARHLSTHSQLLLV